MMGAPMGGGMGGPTGPRPKPKVAPQIVLFISIGAIAGNILSNVGANAGIGILAMIGSALGGLCGLGVLILLILMLIDLKNFTGDPEFNWWMILIPCYGIYYLLVNVREQVRKARSMAGLSPDIKSGVIYFFLPAWALAVDMNDFSEK